MPQQPLPQDDYQEPRCPFCKPDQKAALPLRRVLEKLDAYLNADDYAAAERHLAYWLTEAEACGDTRGALAVYNEQIGLFRKTEQEKKALAACRAALSLADALFPGTVTAATAYINAATAYKAFGKPQDALPLYQKAAALYETLLPPDDERQGGLYNNYALALTDCGAYAEARALYEKALAVMQKAPHGEAECAITHCNLADLAAAERGTEEAEAEIAAHLNTALTLLQTATLPQNGYLAFVLEKCAPTFLFHGFFAAAAELTEKARTLK